jgi:dTDP-4-amino-4,6-dideoxygalactose transaminase
VTNWKIPLSDLCFDHQEEAAVLDVLRRRWLTMGDRCIEFERRFSDYLGGGSDACAVSSGTAALHLALLIGGVSRGDEVILPGLTFVADLNVIWMCGAVPVVADSTSLHNWNISPADIRRKITPRTRAVIVVHFAGYPCDMEAIVGLCRRERLLLIEDAAHAVGTEYRGRKCGTWGDIGCFSFFSNKNLAVGEGGMLVSRDPQVVRKARRLRSHGMSLGTTDRHRGAVTGYDIEMPGLNYRIDEIRAALGIAQLAKLDWMNARRGSLVRRYRRLLRDVPGLVIPWARAAKVGASYHIFTLMLPEGVDRGAFRRFMAKRGVQTSVHYPSFKQFSFYEHHIETVLPLADVISARTVTLPLYPGMSAEDIDDIAAGVKEFCTSQEDSGHECTGRRRAL